MQKSVCSKHKLVVEHTLSISSKPEQSVLGWIVSQNVHLMKVRVS